MLLDFARECLNSGKEPKEVVKKFKSEAVDTKDVEKKVDELIEKNKEMIKAKGGQAFGGLMGDLMKEYKGKVSGKILGDVLRKKLSQLK